MKKVMAVLLSLILLVLPAVQAAAATENVPDNEVYSEANYGGYDLTWDNNGQRDLLMSVTDENGTIYFQYEETGVDIEAGRGSDDFVGMVNVFYTNYPG